MNVADLKKYKESLYNSLCRDLSEFEKNFLLVSGGILAFSITFIKDIVQFDSARFLYFLFAAWIFIIVAIGLMMLTFIKSAEGSDKLWASVDDFIIKNQFYKDINELTNEQANEIKLKINDIHAKSKSLLKKLRYSAVITFLFGVLIFALFVSLNLVQERKEDAEKKGLKINTVEISSNDTILKLNLK